MCATICHARTKPRRTTTGRRSPLPASRRPVTMWGLGPDWGPTLWSIGCPCPRKGCLNGGEAPADRVCRNDMPLK
eukprot:5380253-Alexandrium_andersonii.AAC.1